MSFSFLVQHGLKSYLKSVLIRKFQLEIIKCGCFRRKAAPYKTPNVRPFTSHLTIHLRKTIKEC